MSTAPPGDPGLDVDPVEAAARDVFGDPGGQQVRPAAAAGDLLQGRTDLAHESGQQVSVLPLLPLGKQHRDPREVDGDAVVVVHRSDFPQDGELQVAHPFAAEIPVHVPLVDEPVGMPGLRGDGAFEAVGGIEEVVVVGAVDTVGEEDLATAFPGFVEEHLDRVDPRLPPAGEDVLGARQHLARPDRGVALAPFVPDAVDLVGSLEAAHVEIDQPVEAGGADFAAAEGGVGEDVVLEDDAALPDGGGRVAVGKRHAFSRARINPRHPVPGSLPDSPGPDRQARVRGRFP